MTKIADIEDAILAYAKAAGETGVIPYEWGTADSYPLNWDAELSKTLKWPAIWATFGGFPQPQTLSAGAKVRANFAVVVAAKNKRGGAAAAKGGPIASEAGALGLMEDVISLFMGNDLGLEIGDFELGPVTRVPHSVAMAKAGVSLIVIQFTTEFLFEKASPNFDNEAEFLGRFATLQAEFTLARSEPADDEAADLVSNQTLPTEEAS